MRYGDDVLRPGWRTADKPSSEPVEVAKGMVLEEPTSGWVGAVTRWENGLVVLEDRKGAKRSFPFGPGFWLDGKPIDLRPPTIARHVQATHTASGSRVGEVGPAKVALPSRIYVEGRHDAELVEKIWGDDLRHVGVVVELLNGVDELPRIIDEFAPEPDRRLGVLVDHLIVGSKESRIVEQLRNPHVLVTGHPFVDIWAAVRPERLGLAEWPRIPRDVEWKVGASRALQRPAANQVDIAATWGWILSRVRDWRDLDPALPREVERLIDFVTAG